METRTFTKKARDPVCGMEVDPTKSLTLQFEEKTYHFCADACRKAFEADPGRYLAQKPAKKKGWWGRYLDRLQKQTGGVPPKCCG